MLDLMLGNGPGVFSCGEAYAWFRPFRTHHFKIRCSCNNAVCPVWSKIKDLREGEFHRKAFDMLGVNQIIDSSKELAWVFDSNRWASGKVRVFNLLIWKDPVDLAYSYFKRGHDIWRWRDGFVTYHARLFKLGLPFATVNYRELAEAPGAKLKDVCKAIGVEYFAGKENFWEKEHHQLFGSLGVRKQAEQGKASIKRDGFSSEFLGKVGILEAALKGDAEVRNIIEVLRAHDVFAGFIPEADGRPFNRVVYPFWYYKSIFRKLFRRHFPKPAPAYWR